MINRNISISGGWLLMMAIMVILLPLQWVIASVAAAVFHEFSHWLVMWLITGKGRPMQFRSGSIRMNLVEMGRGEELLCALAGPVSGLLLLPFGSWIPRVAFCAMIQSLYNLLPVYPMDGGRILRCALSMGVCPPVAERIERALSRITQVGLLLLGLYGCLYLHLGLFPLLFCVLMLLRIK